MLGIEAARQSIYKEFSEVIESDGTYINEHHLTLLCDRMTYSKKMISIFRSYEKKSLQYDTNTQNGLNQGVLL